MFDNPDILIIGHLIVIPRLEVLLFNQEKASSVKETDLRDMFKKATKSGCTSTVVLYPDPLSLTVSPSSATKTPVDTEEDPDDPEPADEEDIQRKNLISCTAQE
jgi:hypothetical protein